MTRAHVGVDVAKDWLDVAVLETKAHFRVDNDEAGWRDLGKRLATLEVVAVGLEPSGGYERGCIRALVEAKLKVVRVNAYRVRQFARALGVVAKTDKLDASVIARFVATMPGRAVHVDLEAERLAELVVARRQLCDEKVRLGNQADQVQDATLKRMAKRRIARAAADVVLLDKRIAETIRENESLARKAALMQSVPGVGPVLAHTLLAFMPELGVLSQKQVASLAGVAPFDHESGHAKGRASIRGGRAAVRNVAYMASLAAGRSNPPLTAMKARLVQAGKPPKVVAVALIRKLLIILNAILRTGEAWKDPDAPTPQGAANQPEATPA